MFRLCICARKVNHKNKTYDQLTGLVSCHSAPNALKKSNPIIPTECDYEWSAIPLILIQEKGGLEAWLRQQIERWQRGAGDKRTQGYVGSSSVKVGTKLKNIRLIESDHDISCKIEGFGLMQFKSEFARND